MKLWIAILILVHMQAPWWAWVITFGVWLVCVAVEDDRTTNIVNGLHHRIRNK